MGFKQIVRAIEYTIKNGDTFEAIAKAHGLTWQELVKFNFGTDDLEEVSKYYWGRLGCIKNNEKKNYKLQLAKGANPGILFIPQNDFPANFEVDKTNKIIVKLPDLKIQPTSKALVRIWPQTDWEGKFGFDWMRDGESNLQGDVKYEKFVGKYPAPPYYASSAPEGQRAIINTVDKYTLLTGEYDPFAIPSWKNAYQYMTAYLNLFPPKAIGGNKFKKSEAKIRLFIEIENNQSEKLKFDYNDKLLKLKESEIKYRNEGKWEMLLTVSCVDELDEDEEIEIFNYTNDEKGKSVNHLVGKLVVLKNNIENRFKTTVVIVSVKTSIDGIVNVGNPKMGGKDFLEQMLHQSLISVKIIPESLDLTKSGCEDFYTKYLVSIDPSTNAIYGKPHQYLEESFNKKTKNKYVNCFKIFFLGEPGAMKRTGKFVTGVLGSAFGIPTKSEEYGKFTTVVCFGEHNIQTISHELLHSMGLYHTFDNDSRHTFEFGKTDNIMDYSHWYKIGRIASWKWQWEILRANSNVKRESNRVV